MKKMISVLLALVFCLSLAACQPEPPAVAVPDPPAEALALNPLTGERTMAADRVGQRVYGVDINNYIECLPQYGIARADVVFEFETEGGISRLLCLYADIRGIEHLGPIRSYRRYFLDVCIPLDALLVHWGVATSSAYERAQYLDYSSVSADIFPEVLTDEPARDGIYSPESSIFVSGDKVAAFCSDHASLNRASTFTGTLFDFLSEGETVAAAESAQSVYFPFSAVFLDPAAAHSPDNPYRYDGDLRYDADSGLYLKYQHGQPQIDAGAEDEQLRFTNVLILLTQVDTEENGVTKDFRFEFGGEGYYLTGGGVQKIHWMKEGADGLFRLYGSDGLPLKVRTGKTYVACIDKRLKEEVVFE